MSVNIDRYELVRRHNPVLKDIDPWSPLSVGNGEFAFTVDITGLQTFTEIYDSYTPLCTQSQWGWHSFKPADNKNFFRDNLKLEKFIVNGREVGYATSAEGQEELFNYLRQNPHRLNLASIGFDFSSLGEKPVHLIDRGSIHQELDLWQGVITSRFCIAGYPVWVKTCCHPELDAVAVKAQSPLIKDKKLKILFRFPYGSPAKNASDWESDDKHDTKVILANENTVDLLRIIDDERIFVRISFNKGTRLSRQARHKFVLENTSSNDTIEFTCMFSPIPIRQRELTFEAAEEASKKHWESFWLEGGAIELAHSQDERAIELERRIVLSQYLTAIQCAGSMPPQETGLTCNSWYGKFHLEMHYWHAAHFPLWNRTRLLEKSLWWYMSIMDKAEELAASQGYRGARWPKMVAYDGLDSPSPIGPLLIWQQPHPLMYAELCYRAHPNRQTLERYCDLVFKTADFMASYVIYDAKNDRYVLGPGLIPAQENHSPHIALNPTFELEYWRFGLKIAGLWRRRLGLPLKPKWEEIISKISKLPEKDGVYLAHENCPDTFTEFNQDHPSMLCALGMLPGSMVDRDVMAATLDRVLSSWDFESMWGWDFPVMAMTAARLGQPEKAIDILLMDAPKNTYLPNGHNKQGDRSDLPLYLPGNGALLIAVAMMAAGWDGSADKDAPGFPRNSKWKVLWEKINPLP
jgi:hypothetical protein